MKATCTRHALDRVHSRLGLDERELLALLDSDKAVDVGREPGTNRMHRLFYDAICGHYFVAVQDVRNGEVVTVLPLDYHNRCAWQVDHNLLAMARILTSPEDVPQYTAESSKSVPTRTSTPPKFLVRVCYFKSGKLVRHRLDSVDPSKYSGSLDALLLDADFTKSVLAQLRAAGMSSTDADAVLSVRLGQKGDPKAVPLACLLDQ